MKKLSLIFGFLFIFLFLKGQIASRLSGSNMGIVTNNTGTYMWADPTGGINNMRRSNLADINLWIPFGDTSNYLATRAWVNTRGFLTSFTESDPMVPSYVKSISTGDIMAWNSVFMKLNVSDTLSLSNRINAKFNTPTGTSGQYLNGLGVPVTFPTIPAAQVNADWTSVSGVSQILNKPTTLTGYGITDGVSSSVLSSTLSNYVTTSTYTSGLATKQNQLNGTGFVKVSGTTVSYDNSTYLTSEVDGSVTNELELPSQTGNNGKYLTTNGSSVSWGTVPSQVSLTGGQNTKITGSYPNLTIADSSTVKIYNNAGRVNQAALKIWADKVTPNTGNGYSIDISSAGFSTILSVNVVSEFNNSSTSVMRNVEIKTVSNTAVVVNVAQPNATVVALVGLTLLGVPTFIGSGTGTVLHVCVIGY